MLNRIDTANRLYVIDEGHGYSCLGFDVADRKARAVLAWMGEPADLPTPGTPEHFAAYERAMDLGAHHAASTGQRCPAELVPALIGLEGRRVEATYFGERVRFQVGKSTGWFPVHLRLHNARSTGGEGLIADEVRDVRVVR